MDANRSATKVLGQEGLPHGAERSCGSGTCCTSVVGSGAWERRAARGGPIQNELLNMVNQPGFGPDEQELAILVPEKQLVRFLFLVAEAPRMLDSRWNWPAPIQQRGLMCSALQWVGLLDA